MHVVKQKGKKEEEKNVFSVLFVFFENDTCIYTKGGARSGTLG